VINKRHRLECEVLTQLKVYLLQGTLDLLTLKTCTVIAARARISLPAIYRIEQRG
jgi:hypothetical protein